MYRRRRALRVDRVQTARVVMRQAEVKGDAWGQGADVVKKRGKDKVQKRNSNKSSQWTPHHGQNVLPRWRYGEALRRVMSGKNRVKIGPISNNACVQTGGRWGSARRRPLPWLGIKHSDATAVSDSCSDSDSGIAKRA